MDDLFNAESGAPPPGGQDNLVTTPRFIRLFRCRAPASPHTEREVRIMEDLEELVLRIKGMCTVQRGDGEKDAAQGSSSVTST